MTYALFTLVAEILFGLCLASVAVGYAFSWELFAAICAVDDEAYRRASMLFGTIPGKSRLITMTARRLRKALDRDDVVSDPQVACWLRRLRAFRRGVLIIWSILILWIWTPLIVAMVTQQA